MEPDIAAIAKGLTKAQRKWLPSFRSDPFAGRAVGMSKATLNSLIAAGLVVKHRPAFFGMVKWSLSETGLAVRDYLKGQSND